MPEAGPVEAGIRPVEATQPEPPRSDWVQLGGVGRAMLAGCLPT